MSNKQLIIKRSFNAEINKVWQAFITPEILTKWWYPQGMSNRHISSDVRPGGKFHYCFKSEEGTEYWGLGIYQTIKEPTYLSYIDSFSDAEGNLVAPAYYGIPGDKIMQTLIEVTLKQNGQQTEVTLTMENPYDESMTESMTQGWNSMLDHLNQNLKS